MRKNNHQQVLWRKTIVMLLLSTTGIRSVVVVSLALQPQQPHPSSASSSSLSRRDCLLLPLSSSIMAAAAAVAGAAVIVGGSESPANAATATTGTVITDRDQLLARQASDEEIIGLIQNLKDPAKGRAAFLPDRLDGAWELIWSYGAESFSPLLTLPPPFRPQSYQYLGQAAAVEVGEGRIAQGLTGGILLGVTQQQLWLSSGATPDPNDPSVLIIQPPFRLQWGGRYQSGRDKITLVDSGSDADFRQINARSVDAQSAGPNLYQQLYVEDSGPGSLRVSTVIAGDPVIVGEIFVHRKL
jgi:hypothetical protein